MSTSSMDLDRVLKAALAERAAGGSGNLLEEIVGTAVLTPQRPSVWSLPVLPRRLALVAAATLLLAALLGAVAVLSGLLPNPVPVPVLPENGPIAGPRGGLVAINPETQRVEIEFVLPPGGFEQAVMAPDGTAVAFARGKEVWVQRRGEKAPRHLATCPDGICEGFEWSSDGAFLTIGWGYRAIDVVEVASGRQSSLATAGAEVVAVSWAPDARRLAIVESTFMAEPGGALLRIYDRSGSGNYVVVSGAGPFADVAWSPDGTTLALLGLELDADRALTTSVMTLTLSDGTLQTLANLPETGCAGRCPGYPTGVAWSPDQTQLAVAATYDDLYFVNADGTGIRRIMERVGGSPVWISGPAHD